MTKFLAGFAFAIAAIIALNDVLRVQDRLPLRSFIPLLAVIAGCLGMAFILIGFGALDLYFEYVIRNAPWLECASS